MDEAAVLQIVKDHTSDVTTCDISQTNLLATGSSDKTVRIWRWDLGLGFSPVPYSPLPSHRYAVTWVRFSPQGTMLASSSLDGTTALWNTRSGARIYTLVQATRSCVRRCEFYPDSSTLITSGDDGTLCFWDLLHGTISGKLQLHGGDEACVVCLSISPDAEILATGDTGGLLRVWALPSQSNAIDSELECLSFTKNVNEGVACCAFSPKRELTVTDSLKIAYTLATSGLDGVIILWTVSAQRGPKGDVIVCDVVQSKLLTAHECDVHDVRFNANGGQLCSIGLDKFLRVWQVESGECVHVLSGHSRYGNCCCFAKDSSFLISGSNDKTVIIWDLSGRRNLHSEIAPPCRVSEHFSTEISESHAEELVARHVEEAANKLELVENIDVGSAVNSCCFGINNTLCAAGRDKMVRIWNRNDDDTFTSSQTLQSHKYIINQVDISSCGYRLISCSMDCLLVHYDVRTDLSCELKAADCTTSLRTCAFSPSVDLIAAAGDDEKIFLWDASSLEFIRAVQTHRDTITSVFFSPDGRLLASTCSAGDIGIVAYDDVTGEGKQIILDNAHDLGAASCSFASSNFIGGDDADNRYALASCGNDSLVKIWSCSAAILDLWATLTGHGGNVMCVRFSHSIPYILASAATDNTARVWNVRWRQCIYVVEHHSSIVTTCAFSADTSLLATGSLDKTLAVWRVPHQVFGSGGQLQTFRLQKKLQNWTALDLSQWLTDMGHPNAADEVKANGITGRQLLSSQEDGVIDSCDIAEGEERDDICQLLWWLRQEALSHEPESDLEIPHHYLCPITHELMVDPVLCSDGFTYERAAITEWMLGGRFSSPMTNEPLVEAAFQLNSSLKIAIYQFLYGERPKQD